MDEQLIILAKAGDEQAFEVLLRKAWSIVPKLARKYYRFISVEDVEDAFQEVMISFIRDRLSVRATVDGQFFRWVWVSCERKILDILKSAEFKRKKSLTTTNSEGEEVKLEFEAPENVEKEVIDKEINELLNKAISKFNEVDRIIICDYLKGVPLKQIADKVGLTHDNVRQRKSRAISRLHSDLKDNFK